MSARCATLDSSAPLRGRSEKPRATTCEFGAPKQRTGACFANFKRNARLKKRASIRRRFFASALCAFVRFVRFVCFCVRALFASCSAECTPHVQWPACVCFARTQSARKRSAARQKAALTSARSACVAGRKPRASVKRRAQSVERHKAARTERQPKAPHQNTLRKHTSNVASFLSTRRTLAALKRCKTSCERQKRELRRWLELAGRALAAARLSSLRVRCFCSLACLRCLPGMSFSLAVVDAQFASLKLALFLSRIFPFTSSSSCSSLRLRLLEDCPHWRAATITRTNNSISATRLFSKNIIFTITIVT